MEATATSLSAAIAALAVLLLAMVIVMVRFSAAMIEAPPPAAQQRIGPQPWSRARRLGALYLLVWVAVIAAFLHFLRVAGEGDDRWNLVLLVGVAAAWLGFNTLWIGLVRRLTRAGAGAAPPAPIDLEAEDAALAQLEAEESEEEPAEEGSAEPVLPKPVSRLRRFLTTAGGALLVLTFIALGEALPPLQALAAYLDAHQGAWLGAMGGVALLGFTLLVGGGVSMALASGKPMSRDEVAELERRALARPGGGVVWRKAAAWVSPSARGAQASDEVSFRQLGLAWRLRAWQVSGRWRRIFAMLLGGSLMALGLFGVGIVLAPAGVKFLLIAMVAYAVAKTVSGLRRA